MASPSDKLQQVDHYYDNLDQETPPIETLKALSAALQQVASLDPHMFAIRVPDGLLMMLTLMLCDYRRQLDFVALQIAALPTVQEREAAQVAYQTVCQCIVLALDTLGMAVKAHVV